MYSSFFSYTQLLLATKDFCLSSQSVCVLQKMVRVWEFLASERVSTRTGSLGLVRPMLVAFGSWTGITTCSTSLLTRYRISAACQQMRGVMNTHHLWWAIHWTHRFPGTCSWWRLCSCCSSHICFTVFVSFICPQSKLTVLESL